MPRHTNDIGLALLLLGFPLLLAAVGGVLYLAQRVWGTGRCPQCLKRIPLVPAAALGSSCPHCPAEEAAAAVPAGAVCRRCQMGLNQYTGLSLWDGHTYCRSCVSAVSEELARVAAARGSFRETMPHSPLRVMLTMFGLSALMLNVVFGSAAFAGAGWAGLLAVQFLLLPLTLVFSAAHAGAYSLRRPTTEVANGLLRVWHGVRSFREYPLQDCQWMVESPRYINPFLAGEGIVLVLPREKWKPQEYSFVGSDPQRRPMWEALLTLAEVPRRGDFEHSRWKLHPLLTFLLSALMLPLCFVAGMFAAVVVGAALGLITGDHKLGMILAFPLFVPGTIYLILYITLWRPAKQKLTAIRDTRPEEERLAWWRMFVPMVAINGMICSGLLMWQEMPLYVRIAGCISNLALAIPVALDLARRASKLGMGINP